LAKKLSVSKSNNQQHSIIGLSCLANDYRLLFFVSNQLGISFNKLPDLPFYGKKDKLGEFSFYHFLDDEKHLNYYFFSNKKDGQIAIPAYKNFDYFLLIGEKKDVKLQRDLLSKLRSIPVLQAAMDIPLSSLKDLDLLLEDIELHLIDVRKTRKPKSELWVKS